MIGDVNWRTEVHPDNIDGRPDLGITLNGLLVGHIELKRPGLGARPENFTGSNKSQWTRFKELPNLIYTDGSEWSLYHSGKLSWDRVRISDDIRLGGADALPAGEPGTVRPASPQLPDLGAYRPRHGTGSRRVSGAPHPDTPRRGPR